MNKISPVFRAGLSKLFGNINSYTKVYPTGSTELKTYNSSANVYTCQSDGYVQLNLPGSKLRLYNPQNENFYTILVYTSQTVNYTHCCFVKKGTKLFVADAGNVDGNKFLPLT